MKVLCFLLLTTFVMAGNALPQQPASTTISSSQGDQDAPDDQADDAHVAVEPSNLSADEYSKSIHAFTQNFLSKVLPKEGEEPVNMVFSPLSLHGALALLTSASTDNSTTQKQLLEALGTSRHLQMMENHYHGLLDDYKNLEDVILSGNRLWAFKEYFEQANSSFLSKMEDIYNADLALLSETMPESAVNEWVNNITKGKIDKLFDQLSDDLVLLMTNAIYFKDAWTAPFSLVSNDAEKTFTKQDGSVIKTKMMTRKSFNFRVTPEFQLGAVPNVNWTAVSIPYEFAGAGHSKPRFEMIIAKSGSPSGIAHLADALRGNAFNMGNIFDDITDAIKGLKKHITEEYILTMPVFSVKSDVPVKEALREMNVTAAFDSGEFDKISVDKKFTISQIKHEALIEVDENGTTGAAATGIEVVPLLASLEPKQVLIDSPFLFMVRDTVQKSLLFVGVLENPKPESD